MENVVKKRQTTLLVSDLLALYFSLIISLFVRYKSLDLFSEHFFNFSYLYIFWMLIFYIVGLYDTKVLRSNYDFFSSLTNAFLINSILAVIFFYFLPQDIAPKTNLFLILSISYLVLIIFRYFTHNVIRNTLSPIKITLIGREKYISEMYYYLNNHKGFGYKPENLFTELKDSELIGSKINNNQVIVIGDSGLKNNSVKNLIHKHISKGYSVFYGVEFYKNIFKKIPIEVTEEIYFLTDFYKKNELYQKIKRPVEIFLVLIVFLIFSPFFILIPIIIKLTSIGPVFYSQTRNGYLGKKYKIYKFRTMTNDAEKDGAKWSYNGDPRVTKFGSILRKSHLDELPQLWNILIGDLSFVGPRPERPEFIKEILKYIPYFELRSLVRPGITGWAQINYRYGSNIDDAREKLMYDLYYIKNKSAFFDVIIIIKTIKLFFTYVE